jgi:cytochrome P450
VWKETLRYYPVAPSIPRQALRDVTLGGHHIPAGTVVGVVLSAALRDPSCSTEPDRFDPERFGAERGSLSGNVKLSVEAVGR